MIILWSKLFYIIRSVLTLTMFGNDRALRVANMFGFQSDFSFTFKCVMKVYPNFLTFGSFLLGTIYFGV